LRSQARFDNSNRSRTRSRLTQYTYDPLGRLTRTVLNADPATLGTRTDTNRTTTYQYDPTTGWPLGEQDALGRAITVTADCTPSSATPDGRVTVHQMVYFPLL
jgi:YD repeat-containing protein